ncbi:MAG: hypothetical protein M3Y87_08010 [Myxococcota bacterium]|nr:hypothetical protein [Myxococcota bacterium]
MSSFATLPFDAQLARISALAQGDEDPRALLRDAGALADAEPLAALFVGAGELAPIRERTVHEPSQTSRRALPLYGRPNRAVQEASSRATKTGAALREILPSLFEPPAAPPEET